MFKEYFVAFSFLMFLRFICVVYWNNPAPRQKKEKKKIGNFSFRSLLFIEEVPESRSRSQRFRLSVKAPRLCLSLE